MVETHRWFCEPTPSAPAPPMSNIERDALFAIVYIQSQGPLTHTETIRAATLRIVSLQLA
jgi:hypothetical protein